MTANPTNAPAAQPVFVSVPKAAERLACSPGLLYRLVREGDFPALKLGDKKYLIPMKAVDELVDLIVATGGLIDIADWTKARDALNTDSRNNTGLRSFK